MNKTVKFLTDRAKTSPLLIGYMSSFPPFKKFSLFDETIETIQTTHTNMEEIDSVEKVIQEAKRIVAPKIVMPSSLDSIKKRVI